jgi:alpha/beta hydrolase fold
MKPIYFLLSIFFSTAGFSQSTFMKEVAPRPFVSRSVATQIVATIDYQGYEETQSYFGEGEYEVFLDNVDGVLDKPIIVLDGFDPGDSRDISGLYNSLSFDGDNLADILRGEGFDIVILNAPQYTTNGKDIDGGSDYIQRNAMVLIEMINFLNVQKVGDEELVVLGPSMGGLIARYALSFMEQDSLEHQTRLYISFDSPHRGANIPVSLQYLINYLAESLGDPDAQAIVDFVLNSPAAKEMLIDHLSGHLLTGSTYEQDPTKLLPEGAPIFRDAFQSEMDVLGFPQNVRNVSMINGSGLSMTTGTAGMQVVDTTLDLGNSVTADVVLHFMPSAGQTNNVTFFETFFLGIPLDLFSADAESFPFSDGVDSAPGGTANISGALAGGGGNQVIIDFIAALDQDDYSFVPTLSALAIDNEDDWYIAPDIGGNHNSAFVNTFIPDVNEPHVSVTQANAQFALDEIRQVILGVNDSGLMDRYLIDQNPVGERIQIRLNPSLVYGKVEIIAFSLSGQLLLHTILTNPTNGFSLDHSLASGVYLLSIYDSEGIYNLKFVVR